MTSLSATARSYTDEEFAALVATLSLSNSPSPTPRTPSPQHQEPPVIPSTPSSRRPLYYYESPTMSGYTTSWATAGAATQGMANAHVRAVEKRTKKRTKKAAYTVFYGNPSGVFLTWDEAAAAVRGVKGSIFRGYATVPDAHAAYAYARARGWTRSLNGPVEPSMAALPSPSQPLDSVNPLHGTDALNETWYIVYRGIRPGVYHSFLEVMLNTSGLSNTLYDSVTGRAEAFALFAQAQEDGNVLATLAPPYTSPSVPSYYSSSSS
ncbi:hypothetical protein B0H11DRAFT_2247749 [Mycena galericulata]|nr:hypothetical protein B0H11DRAFT_2264271 [Mycena galericulata]KAJ7448452.1 hypothetical protein B0H11DRAFT_2247739 [Mycena galericulata]KAJ7448462.1 hypothetical protein B0H11DRAFT_2247749 [Mycena galericulata]